MHAIIPIIDNKEKIEEIKNNFDNIMDEYGLAERILVDWVQPIHERFDHPEMLSLKAALEDAQDWDMMCAAVIANGEHITICDWEEYQRVMFDPTNDYSPSVFSITALKKARELVAKRFRGVLEKLLKYPDYSKDLVVYYVDAHF